MYFIFCSNISHWVPAEKPVFDKKSEILYLGEESESTRPNRRRYNFQAVGKWTFLQTKLIFLH